MKNLDHRVATIRDGTSIEVNCANETRTAINPDALTAPDNPAAAAGFQHKRNGVAQA